MLVTARPAAEVLVPEREVLLDVGRLYVTPVRFLHRPHFVDDGRLRLWFGCWRRGLSATYVQRREYRKNENGETTDRARVRQHCSSPQSSIRVHPSSHPRKSATKQLQ